MKRQVQMAAAVGIGLGLALFGAFSLAAPTRMAYVVIEIDEISDAQAFDSLKATGISSMIGAQMADGRYLARSEDTVPLDGVAPKAIVIISFDNESKARSYYDNSKETTSLRMKAGKSRAFVVRVCSERGVLSQNC
jgi:uncharacterized protein (DUF1330 family)